MERHVLVRLLAGGTAVGVPDVHRLTVLHQWSEALAEAVDELADAEIELLVHEGGCRWYPGIVLRVAHDAGVDRRIRGEPDVPLGLVAAARHATPVDLEGQIPRRAWCDPCHQRAGIQDSAGLGHRNGCGACPCARKREALVSATARVVRDAHPDDSLGGGGERGRQRGPVQDVAASADDRRGRRDDDAGSVRGVVGRVDVIRLLGVEGRDAGAELPETIGELHYLTAPAVMPRVSVRWKMRKKMSVGMMPRSAEALVVVTSIRRSPCSTLIATGTV